MHIAPLGHEHDRIVEPFLPHGEDPPKYKPHKLILVVPGLGGADGFDKRITESLKGICDVEVHEVDRYDGDNYVGFEAVLAGMADVMARELHAGNRIWVNISGGGKLDSFAAGLASMAYITESTGGMYYVDPENYAKSDEEKKEHGIGVGFKQVIEIQPLAIGAPSPPRVWALSFIESEGGKADYNKLLRFMRTVPNAGLDDLDFTDIDAGKSKLIGGDKSEDSKARMRLKRSILDPLHEEGYILVRRLGRKRIVTLTRKGQMYAHLAPPVHTLTD